MLAGLALVLLPQLCGKRTQLPEGMLGYKTGTLILGGW
jgi:hypothetical protein